MAVAAWMFCSTARTATPSATRVNRGNQRLYNCRGKSLGWLVHQDQLAVQHQRPAHCQHLLLSPGQVTSTVLAALGEAGS